VIVMTVRGKKTYQVATEGSKDLSLEEATLREASLGSLGISDRADKVVPQGVDKGDSKSYTA